MKIIDPHLVSTFFDDYKRVYLHAILEMQNKSSWAADCSVKIQVTTELEGNICLVEHLQAQKVSVPAGSIIQYSFPRVGSYIFLWQSNFDFFLLFKITTLCVLLKGKRKMEKWNPPPNKTKGGEVSNSS